jgi:hypothetical protein
VHRLSRLTLGADKPHLTARRVGASAYGLRITVVVVGGEA